MRGNIDAQLQIQQVLHSVKLIHQSLHIYSITFSNSSNHLRATYVAEIILNAVLDRIILTFI
jgi:hypothetical protein